MSDATITFYLATSVPAAVLTGVLLGFTRRWLLRLLLVAALCMGVALISLASGSQRSHESIEEFRDQATGSQRLLVVDETSRLGPFITGYNGEISDSSGQIIRGIAFQDGWADHATLWLESLILPTLVMLAAYGCAWILFRSCTTNHPSAISGSQCRS